MLAGPTVEAPAGCPSPLADFGAVVALPVPPPSVHFALAPPPPPPALPILLLLFLPPAHAPSPWAVDAVAVGGTAGGGGGLVAVVELFVDDIVLSLFLELFLQITLVVVIAWDRFFPATPASSEPEAEDPDAIVAPEAAPGSAFAPAYPTDSPAAGGNGVCSRWPAPAGAVEACFDAFTTVPTSSPSSFPVLNGDDVEPAAAVVVAVLPLPTMLPLLLPLFEGVDDEDFGAPVPAKEEAADDADVAATSPSDVVDEEEDNDDDEGCWCSCDFDDV